MATKHEHITVKPLRRLAVRTDTLTLDPANAMDHPEENVEAIKGSLRRFGVMEPIGIRDGVVIRGNGTLTALRELAAERATGLWNRDADDNLIAETEPLAWDTVPALPYEHLSTLGAKRWGVTHNQSAKLSTWNWGQLAETLAEGDPVEWEDLGWPADELASIVAGEWAPPEMPEETTTVGEHERALAGDDAEDTPPKPTIPITQPGDLWLLGQHRLLCGDSMDAGDRARLLDGRLADMALMDPPFAIYGSSTGIGADIADDKMIRPFFVQLGHAIAASIIEFAHAYVCCDWRSWASVWAGMAAAKLSPKNCLVWDKKGGLGSMYAQCYELIGFFVREPPPASMKNGRISGHRQVYKPNVLAGFNRPTGDERLHNAAKPVPMMAELIENSSDAGDLVLDLFNGSGTVIMAGEQTGRVVAAMEIEPGMCDVTVARWERATGQRAERVERSATM